MRHLMPTRLLLLSIVALFVVACGGASPSASAPASSDPSASADPGGSAPGPSGPVDPSGDWLLVDGTVDGAPFPVDPAAPVTFMLDGTRVSGTSACNSYGGEIVVQDGEVRFGEMMMTMMGCEEPASSIEAAYHLALGRIRLASFEDEDLILAGDGVRLHFEPIPPVPTAELVDTTWTLDTIFSGEVASSVLPGKPATLLLQSDGRFEGHTGCRAFGGRYTVEGGEVVATELVTDDNACTEPMASQDTHVLTVLGDGFTASIDGDRLTVTAGGLGLGYTAAE